MRLNTPSLVAGLSLSVANSAMAEDIHLPENGLAQEAIVAVVKIPVATEPRVDAMTAGTYKNVAFVLAHSSPSEATNSKTWQYELDIVERMFENPHVHDSKPPERFLEPGSTFRITSDRGSKGERKAVLTQPPAGVSEVLWLHQELPASCFVPAGVWKASPIEANPQVCFVPFSGRAK